MAKIFCDMDSVLTDFIGQLGKILHKDLPPDYSFGNDPKVWKMVEEAGESFWEDMVWMSDGKELWRAISKYNPTILSAPTRHESSKIGKRAWIKRELPKGTTLIMDSDKGKYAKKGYVLIDDRVKNIKEWEEAGGIGILHKNAKGTIKELDRVLKREKGSSRKSKIQEETGILMPGRGGTVPSQKVLLSKKDKERTQRPSTKEIMQRYKVASKLRQIAQGMLEKHRPTDHEAMPLPYPPDSLEPILSRDTVLTHYIEHHHVYADKLAELLEDSKSAGVSLPELIRQHKDDEVYKNAAQLWNHNLYWRSLSPGSVRTSPHGKVSDLISEGYKTLDSFIEVLKKEARKLKGDGWLWVYVRNGKIDVCTTDKENTILGDSDKIPLLAVDLWEHSYARTGTGDREEYLDNVLHNLLNWDFAEERYNGISG